MSEFQFIEKIAKMFPGSRDVICGIGDDCAVVEYSKKLYQLLAIDTIVEDVHFKRGKATYEQIGQKALGSNISDIAAMGGFAKYALVSIAVPKSIKIKQGADIYKGLKKMGDKFGLQVVGGDTVYSAGKLVISVAVAGFVEKNKLVKRTGAGPGDDIFCTGTLGGAKNKHLTFVPRQKEARWLVNNTKINAMIDISDGLVQDLGHLLGPASCGAILYKEYLPVRKHMKKKNVYEDALYKGEEFELLFAVPNKSSSSLINKTKKEKIMLSKIGRICSDISGIVLEDGQGKRKRLKPGGYEHRVF